MQSTNAPAGELKMGAEIKPAICGARTPSGSPCSLPPELGRRRCRLHGGAAGSGAPSGVRNGRYVDGHHSNEARAERHLIRQILAGSGGGNMTNERPSKLTANSTPPASGTRRIRRRVTAQVYQSGRAGEFSVRAPVGQTTKEWTNRLRKAFGSDSKTFVDASLQRLLAVCRLPRHAIPTSTALSAALALIESMEPQNEIEAALAVDVACLHAVCGNLLGRLAWSATDRPLVFAANATAKLERALHSAIKTFFRLKHGNIQVIRVEKLEVQPGGQALVGQLVERAA
jgi:hypothetical protein